MRLIDADALLEKMKHRREYVGRPSDAICLVEDAPTIDVMPAAHGRWIDADTRTGHHLLTQCSECSYGFYGDVSYWVCCPVCGSKMDGDEHGN